MVRVRVMARGRGRGRGRFRVMVRVRVRVKGRAYLPGRAGRQPREKPGQRWAAASK